MYRKDYQNALNELRLSSSFCEEMEKKLSASPSDEDYYEDAVSHVEVVKKRSPKKFAAIAAAAAIIGTAGGGALLNISDNIKKDPFADSGIYETETTTAESSSNSTVFDFPFASIDLSKFTCGYFKEFNCLSYASSGSVSEELCSLLKSFEMTKTEYPRIRYSNTDYISFMSSYPEASGINLYIDENDYLEVVLSGYYYNNNSNNTVMYADVNGDGGITLKGGEVSVDSDPADNDGDSGEEKHYELDPNSLTTEYYYLGSGAFNKVKELLYGNDKFTDLDFLGVSGDLITATFDMKTRDGMFTASEAYNVATILNQTLWHHEDNKNAIPESEETFTIHVEDENKKCSICMSEKGNAVITCENTKGNESSFTSARYSFDPEIYTKINKILKQAEKLTEECPLGDDIWDYDHAMICKKDYSQKSRPFYIEGENLKELITVFKDMTWQHVRSSEQNVVYTGTPENIYIGPYVINYNPGMIFIMDKSDNGVCDNFAIDTQTTAKLNRIIKDAEKTDLSDSEITELVINADFNELLYVEYAKCSSSYPYSYMVDSYSPAEYVSEFVNSINSILISRIAYVNPRSNDTELKEVLLSLDWEVTEPVLLTKDDVIYQAGNADLTEDGYLNDHTYDVTLKCSEPEKYLAVLDKMFIERAGSNEKAKYVEARGDALITSAP